MNLRTLIGQIATLLVVMAACHAVLILLTVALQPPGQRVDALAHRQTLYRGQFRTVVQGMLEGGAGDSGNLVIVGASNALLGFRPDEVEEAAPGVRVQNLATASMRADEIRDVVQTAWSLLSDGERQRTTFVVTLIFASFPRPASLYARRQDGIAAELRRTGLFGEHDGHFVARWSPRTMRIATLLARPVALADMLRDELSSRTYGMRAFLLGAYAEGVLDPGRLAREDPSDIMLFPKAEGPDGRAASLAFFKAVLPGDADAIDPAQVDELTELARWAAANDVRLVLVAMPVPQWVREGLSFYEPYRSAVDRIASLTRTSPTSTVRFVDLSDAGVPLWDATHPEPTRTREWAAMLVDALRSAHVPLDAGSGPR